MIVPILREQLRHRGQSNRHRGGRYHLKLLLRHWLEIHTAPSAATVAVAVPVAVVAAAVI